MQQKNEIKDILDILANCDDSLSRELTIVSKDLIDKKDKLRELNIKYEETAEGIRVDLSQQAFVLYKNKEDCIAYYKPEYANKNILIIQDKIYSKQECSDIFFDNLIYSSKILDLIKNKIASYEDEIHKKIILLSEVMGKFDVGYKLKPVQFYNNKHNLKTLYDILSDKLEYAEYISFFRNNIIKSLENERQIDTRFIKLLENLEIIMQKTEREFELFKNKFSFDDFFLKFNEDKNKYFKNMNDILSDIHSKINSMPIQFGVYIFLMFRFENQLIPLLAVMVIIAFWSYFGVKSIDSVRKLLKSFEKSFNENYENIKSRSKLNDNDLNNEKENLCEKTKAIYSLITCYKRVVIVFTICCVLFILYEIFCRVDG